MRWIANSQNVSSFRRSLSLTAAFLLGAALGIWSFGQGSDSVAPSPVGVGMTQVVCQDCLAEATAVALAEQALLDAQYELAECQNEIRPAPTPRSRSRANIPQLASILD